MSGKTTRPELRLTERDVAVLEALAEQRFLSIPQLAVLFFPSKGAATARMRRLYDHRLVVQVFVPARPYDRKTYTIYALSAQGSKALVQVRGGERPKHLSSSERRSGLFLDHTLRRNDFRICAELVASQTGLEMSPWLQAPEDVRASAMVQIPNRGLERVPIVPDGAFTFRRENRADSFAVEIDMGTVAVRRMRNRYLAYAKDWRRGGAHRRYGYMAHRVLTVTTTKRRLDALHAAALDASDSGNGSGLFWFALLEDVADIQSPEGLLGPVWRPGLRDASPTERLVPHLIKSSKPTS